MNANNINSKIISFYNHKGGVSKTTSTIITATNLSFHFGKKIAIIDCDDDQWSTSEEKEDELEKLQSDYTEEEIENLLNSKKITEYDVYKGRISKDIKDDIEYVDHILDEIKGQYDYIFLDMGNRSLNHSEKIFKEIDYFLIPFSQDKSEIKKACQFYQIVNDLFSESTPYLLMVKLNKTRKRMENHKAVFEYLNNELKFNMFEQAILERDRYIERYKSFFFPIKKIEEEKEGLYNYFNFLNEFIKKTSL